MLYIVATPLGNLADFSQRAIETLKSVSLIAAEDTRHSKKLLQHYNIATPLIALHEHNEKNQIEKILTHLKNGESLALISDAGTPLISDPGFKLVRTVREAGFEISPIPGACALVAALSASGLPSDRFVFEGFLPAKNQARLEQLKLLQHETRTLIFYEAPHRLIEALASMIKIFGEERLAVLAKEISKMFETFKTGTLKTLLAWLEKDEVHQKGEFVVIVHGAEKQAKTIDEGLRVLDILLKHFPLKQAVVLAADITGEKKNNLYSEALKKEKTTHD